ncbi:MarR family transcriptional regulator [Pigmentiphaga sp. GD03639]|jgi:MarR family transcriptional regulator for hemolysin|uniref:MarR family transcriptional regulator n=1 Tax=Pigmentiphaga daeguensis TaxID=414049 RepID=A0ABN1CFB3_9BURK|nr:MULTISPECIES: MarR family transcriptional regulator [unclassified Pigmentiphaga]MDH2239317.1 MarR family transcriptional regulator [Pigmentiphaga sp. GD03639]
MNIRTQSLGFVVGTLNRRIVWRLAQLTGPHGVMPGQFPVLRCLRDVQVSTQMELARMVGVEQPSMAATLTRMEKNGLIARVSDEQDARRRLVSLTERGKEMLTLMTDSAMEVYKDACEDLTPDEVAEFLRIGAKMIENLEEEK